MRIAGADAGSDGRTKTVAGQGVWTVGGDGAITFTPEADFVGAVTPIEYTVIDKLGAVSEVAEVSVEITPVPDDAITFAALFSREITGVPSGAYRLANFDAADRGLDETPFEDLVFGGAPDPARVGDVFVGGTTATASREFFAVLETKGATGTLGAGDTLSWLSGYEGADKLAQLSTLNTAADPVTVRAEGVRTSVALGDLSAQVRFGERGFGLRNGLDCDVDARWLNRGDPLTFRATGADGIGDAFDTVSFTVRTDRASATLGLDADRDGRLLADTNRSARAGGFADDGADVFLTGLADGDAVEIDFRAEAVRVNGVALPEDFRSLFDNASRIGLGASLAGGRWAIDDLTFELA